MMQIGGQASPDFSDPLGMLKACHQRMLDLCDLLERMCLYQDEHGNDQAMIESAHKVMRYFDIAAPLHHADEEENLFPELSEHKALQTLIEALKQEHQDHQNLWLSLKVCLDNIAAAQTCADLSKKSTAFVQAYRDHIKIENEQILPQARQLIAPEELSRIGQAMAERRR